MKPFEFISRLSSTIASIGKMVLLSRMNLKSPGVTKKEMQDGGTREIIIMGNGPSLRKTITEHETLLKENDTMAVNFAANTPEFFILRPKHYVLADPHFFEEGGNDPNVIKLWENLSKADWQLTLHLPGRLHVRANEISRKLPKNIKIAFYNLTPGEGFKGVCHYLYRQGLAMPRPRNVLIPAIMEAIHMGYGKIYLAGADHTWPHTLYVDDQNRVVSVQPHFYKDNPDELDRVAAVYAGVRIHDVLGNMATAFKSYHAIEDFARSEGVEIYNVTPGSLIDAFRRKSL